MLSITSLRRLSRLGALLCAIAPAPALSADALEAAIGVQTEIERDAAQSQRRVDETYETTRQLLEEYKSKARELESLRRYNDHLARMTETQDASIRSLESQIEEAQVTRRDIIPLMTRMAGTLERFVELDVPFLTVERLGRVAGLREMIDSPDISIGEKYRRVLEAYQIEMDYGRTVDAYRGTLPLGGEDRSVDFLRVGRISLLYRSLDGSESGFWDKATGSWRPLSDEYRGSLAKGLRVAQKQSAPDLLRVPVPAPEVRP